MNRPIRVLELRSVAGTGGGPDKTLLASARYQTSDVVLTLCYLCNAGDTVFAVGQRAREMGLDYVELRERTLLDWQVWKALRALVKDRAIDIVHGHEYKTDLLAYGLAKAEKVVPFATAHGWTGNSWRERRVYYPADKRLLASFPRVVAVSTEIKNTLIRAGADSERISVVLNGIDANAFKRDRSAEPAARRNVGVTDGDLVIGSVGRLERQKRFDLLIDAFASLTGEYPRARLLIGGEGSLRASLQAQIERFKLDGRARLLGQVEVTPFHHAIDVFVQSSDYEGTPNVVLEAMALETPTVATRVGGTDELMADQQHGLLVPPGDSKILADAIRRLLSDPGAARRMAQAARSRIEGELSFDHRMQRINAIYTEVMAAR